MIRIIISSIIMFLIVHLGKKLWVLKSAAHSLRKKSHLKITCDWKWTCTLMISQQDLALKYLALNCFVNDFIIVKVLRPYTSNYLFWNFLDIYYWFFYLNWWSTNKRSLHSLFYELEISFYLIFYRFYRSQDNHRIKNSENIKFVRFCSHS